MREVRETTKHGLNLLFIPVMIGLGLAVVLYHISPLSVLIILIGLFVGIVLLVKHPFGVKYVMFNNDEEEYVRLSITFETNGENNG